MAIMASYATYSKISIGWLQCLSMVELSIGLLTLRIKTKVENDQLMARSKRLRWTFIIIVLLTMGTVTTFALVYGQNFVTIDS